MSSEDRKQWWRHLAGMGQGLLFLGGHIVDPGVAAGEGRNVCERSPVRAAVPRRRRRASLRLGFRRLRAATALSLFR